MFLFSLILFIVKVKARERSALWFWGIPYSFSIFFPYQQSVRTSERHANLGQMLDIVSAVEGYHQYNEG